MAIGAILLVVFIVVVSMPPSRRCTDVFRLQTDSRSSSSILSWERRKPRRVKGRKKKKKNIALHFVWSRHNLRHDMLSSFQRNFAVIYRHRRRARLIPRWRLFFVPADECSMFTHCRKERKGKGRKYYNEDVQRQISDRVPVDVRTHAWVCELDFVLRRRKIVNTRI